MTTATQKYLAEIGRKGGSAGNGNSKKRDPAHYRKMVEIRAANRRKLKLKTDPLS